MRETPNSYLSAYLVMVGIRALTISRNAPVLSLRRSSLGRYETLLRPGRKLTHVHIMNRTCPYGKGMSAQPPMEALLVYVQHKENIIDFSL